MKEHYFTVKVTVTGDDVSTAHFEIIGDGLKNPVWNEETGNWETTGGANAAIHGALCMSLRDAIFKANLSV